MKFWRLDSNLLRKGMIFSVRILNNVFVCLLLLLLLWFVVLTEENWGISDMEVRKLGCAIPRNKLQAQVCSIIY